LNKTPEILNRQARYKFHILEEFTAGMALKGTEVKSLRDGKASFKDSFCLFVKNELYIRNLHIAEYSFGSSNNHDPIRERKLLLNRQEMKKILKRMKEKGHTLVPLRIFFSEKGYAKIDIALAKGKNTFDKSQSIKKRDMDRDLKRSLKY